MVTTTISAKVIWKDGNRFVGRSGSGHEVEVEGLSRNGVPAGAPTPTELALIALGTCTGVVVAGVLIQGGEQLEGLEIELEANPLEGTAYGISDIRLRYRVAGGITRDKVERALDLSTDALGLLKDLLGARAEIRQEFVMQP